MSGPGPVPLSERFRGLPNTLAMVLAGGLFVIGALLVTLPFDAEDGAATTECASPMFELVVPADEGDAAKTVPVSTPCRDEAGSRVLVGMGAMAIGVAGGVATRQIRRRRYDPRRLEVIDARAR